jgi:hypothetical protein
MATLTNLTARLERLEQQSGQTASRYHILYLHPGEDEYEAIARQKRELGVRDEDSVIVVRFVAPPVRDE